MSGAVIAEMPTARLHEWLAAMWASYREDLVAAGATPEEADVNVARNQAALTSGEGLAEGQHVFQVLVDGAEVGVVWIGLRPGDPEGSYFVYNVEVGPEHRGRGYGRAAMSLAEEWVRAAGGTRIGLSVFGNNAVARSLYLSLGYQELAVSMVKDLGP